MIPTMKIKARFSDSHEKQSVASSFIRNNKISENMNVIPEEGVPGVGS